MGGQQLLGAPWEQTRLEIASAISAPSDTSRQTTEGHAIANNLNQPDRVEAAIDGFSKFAHILLRRPTRLVGLSVVSH